jgi:3-oxoacyl-[acyl-carrier-protein] synthase-1
LGAETAERNRARGSQNPAVVTGMALVSAVGLGLEQSCAAVRAKVSGFQEDSSFLCVSGPPDWIEEPLICARVPGMDPDAGATDWLIRAAIQDLVRTTGLKRNEFAQARLFVGLASSARPASRPAPPADSLSTFLGVPATPGMAPAVFAAGHCGGLLALQAASEALRSGQAQACVVVAADSHLDPSALAWLDEHRRLKGPGNSAGLIPGEAGAAVLLESPAHAQERGAAALAVVESVGTASEAVTVVSDGMCTGEGLTAAIRAAVGAAGISGIEWVACDLNGEAYRAAEWGHCQARLGSTFAGLRAMWHPADCLGDTGAAAGGALISLVARAFQKGYAPAGNCLLWTSSDFGERAAAVLRRA